MEVWLLSGGSPARGPRGDGRGVRTHDAHLCGSGFWILVPLHTDGQGHRSVSAVRGKVKGEGHVGSKVTGGWKQWGAKVKGTGHMWNKVTGECQQWGTRSKMRVTWAVRSQVRVSSDGKGLIWGSHGEQDHKWVLSVWIRSNVNVTWEARSHVGIVSRDKVKCECSMNTKVTGGYQKVYYDDNVMCLSLSALRPIVSSSSVCIN